MNEVVSSIRRGTDIVAEITAASNEQSAGIEQVNQAIAQMGHTTQKNPALVEEAAAASESMQEQAGWLAQAVRIFKLHDAQHGINSVAVRPVKPATNVQPAVSGAGSVVQPRKQETKLAAPAVSSGEWQEF